VQIYVKKPAQNCDITKNRAKECADQQKRGGIARVRNHVQNKQHVFRLDLETYYDSYYCGDAERH
jgi:hypothetical protein